MHPSEESRDFARDLDSKHRFLRPAVFRALSVRNGEVPGVNGSLLCIRIPIC